MHLSAPPLLSNLLLIALSCPWGRVNAECLRGDGPTAFPRDGSAVLTLDWAQIWSSGSGQLRNEAYELTSRNPENATGPALEGIVSQFNETHFGDKPSFARWIALFNCENQIATADLISNAARLGAQAILAYSDTFKYCVTTGDKPPSPIPIYTVSGPGGSFGAWLDRLFPTSSDLSANLPYYNSTQFDAAADQAEHDLRLLDGGSPPGSLTPGTLLGRFFRNVTFGTTPLSDPSTTPAAWISKASTDSLIPTTTPETSLGTQASAACIAHPFYGYSTILLTGNLLFAITIISLIV
ncbi:hypothetical protein Hypma_012985 [Hypsizygus marmoreus]|uniref:Uncharacterized protein n=1 Tax=Hypsizygus marmoreus TaxID=39966 RepID=A0A369JKW0_HYPMA|nr:hypothetical protein Hypma_012985 [Hypsizygus marmoreus]